MALLQDFGPVWVGSGTRGFFGEGYPWHKLAPGLSFEGSTFVAKTTTYRPNKGNMEFEDCFPFEPTRFFPDCIVVKPVRGVALNSVGLSGPGFVRLLGTGHWQRKIEPFFISFMPINPDESKQWEETHYFGQMLEMQFHNFRSICFGLQVNVSCPNVGADLDTTKQKALMILDELAHLRIPIVVKISVLVKPEDAAEIAAHPACSGLCISNTIPFGKFPDKISWLRYFPNGSPLAEREYGPGGLSGAPLFQLVRDWIKKFRDIDTETHVNAGGGIMNKEQVELLRYAGASSISIASVAMFRPWRVPGIIKRAHEVFQ